MKILAGDAAYGPPFHHLHFIPSSFYGAIQWSWCKFFLSVPTRRRFPTWNIKALSPHNFPIMLHLFPYPERPPPDPRIDARYC